MRKLKKGFGKYKGTLPFKCFNCEKVGHFASKSPYVKNESSDDKEDHNIKRVSLINTKRTKKRINIKRIITSIRKIKEFTPMRIATYLKKAMNVSLIVTEKRLS